MVDSLTVINLYEIQSIITQLGVNNNAVSYVDSSTF